MADTVPPAAARAPFAAGAVADAARAHGLVIVAGAGLSMVHPSSLPGWAEINDAFVESLALTIAQHTDGEVGYDIAQLVLDRRDDAAAAQPDLQAELAEESAGRQYFAVFRALDIDTWNDGHAAIARIARAGWLRAVVTTNFDRLIEHALAAHAVPHAVFCAPADFDRLDTSGPAVLPVIKVHGSVERPQTMVDTLGQRLQGRPQALEAALRRLFAGSAVLVVGLSGADLRHDPKYLALQDAALHSPSFTVLNLAGQEPHAAMAALAASAPGHAPVVDGSLPHPLVDLANALGAASHDDVRPRYDSEIEHPGLRRATLRAEVHDAFGRALSPVVAAVLLARLADAAGSGDAALHVLRRTMPHHQRAGLADDPAMEHQVALLAHHLIERGLIASELYDGRFETSLSALQVLQLAPARASAWAHALAAHALALSGEAGNAVVHGLKGLRMSRQAFHPLARADTVCALARWWMVDESWQDAEREALAQAHDLMADWGDSVRWARTGVLLARYEIETDLLDAAQARLAECNRVVDHLNLPAIGNELNSVYGRLELASGRPHDALPRLWRACRHAARSQLMLRHVEMLLPTAEAAAAAGNVDVLMDCTRRFDEWITLVPGMAMPRAASRVRMFLRAGDRDGARSVVAELRELGARWSPHPPIDTLAGRLEARIAGAPPAPAA